MTRLSHRAPVLEGSLIVPTTTPVPRADLAEMLDKPRRLGAVTILLFVVLFIGWGSLAPLAGGALAPGRISPDGGVRTVQHLEGGIIEAFHVDDGDLVTAGDPLMTLSGVGAIAEVDALHDRRMALVAERARLEAEAVGAEAITFPPEVAGDPRVVTLVALERRTFEARRHTMAVRERVLSQRIAQLKEEIAGYEAQVDSATERLALLEEELAAKAALLEKGLTPLAEVLRLRGAAAEIKGFRGEKVARIAGARKEIGETELKLIALDAERAEAIAERSNEIRDALAETEQLLAKGEDVLGRTEIRAPVDGRVANLRINTEGGVVLAGEPILDIVPTHDALLVDAQVAPNDIDIVREGATAQVNLPAFSGRAAPTIKGVVTLVAPDTVVDERTGRSYYLARIEVPRPELDKLGEEVQLIPGMTADVLIVDRERTFVSYIIQPVADVVRRSLRET